MKRVVCILSLVALLFVGSGAVFADPHTVPDTESCSINLPNGGLWQEPDID